MKRVTLDAYVIDVLMPDLVAHDRKPAAFLVYLYLAGQVARNKRDTLSVSLQTIATKTGLSKSSVQGAIRHLRRRRLLDPDVVASASDPKRRILHPLGKA